jgi:hypothetical protein
MLMIWMMMNMEMMAGTGTVLIMGIEMRVGGRWSILFSTIKISMRTRHEKVRSREGKEKRRGSRCEWRQSNGEGSVRCTVSRG